MAWRVVWMPERALATVSSVERSMLSEKFYGIGLSLLAAGLVLTAERPMGMKPLVLAVVCGIIGCCFLIGSLSRKIAREARLAVPLLL